MEEKKMCCMFKCETAEEANKKALNNLVVVEEYGSKCNGHSLHTSDSGERWLARCKECGAYVLVQYSEVWYQDKEYYDYYPVESIEHARELNKKYDGYGIEFVYQSKKLFITNGKAMFK